MSESILSENSSGDKMVFWDKDGSYLAPFIFKVKSASGSLGCSSGSLGKIM